MRRLPLLADAALAICKRDFLIFASYRTRFASTFFATAVSITLFYYVSRLVETTRFGSQDAYFAFVVVGLVIFGVLTSTLTSPVMSLRAELQSGTFERMVVSPFGPVRSIASMLIFPVLMSLVLGVLSLVYATAVFGVDLRWETVAAAIPIALLAALAFAPFGLVLTAAVVLFKQTNAGAAFFMAAMSLLAGVYFPVDLLPNWIEWASDVQPFTPAVDLLRNTLVGTPLPDPLWSELGRLLAFAAVLLPLAFLVLRAAVARSRRLGTIIEY